LKVKVEIHSVKEVTLLGGGRGGGRRGKEGFLSLRLESGR